MRKYRGKTKISNKWVYGYVRYFESEDKYFIEESIEGYEYEVVKDTIGQFTGKLDKNGDKIFENDIVKYIIGIEGYTSTYNEHISCVKFEDCKFYPFTSSDIIETEVIGNIHDNPNLLSEVCNEK